MNRKRRILGVITLLLFVTGCGGYRTVGSFDGGGDEGPSLGNLKSGDEVKLYLKSGPKIQGKVMELGKESLTIMLADSKARDENNEREGNIGEFAYQEINTVKIRVSNTVGNIIAIIVLGGVVFVTVGLASIDFGNSTQ